MIGFPADRCTRQDLVENVTIAIKVIIFQIIVLTKAETYEKTQTTIEVKLLEQNCLIRLFVPTLQSWDYGV
jgi:hypothetical protein